MLQLLTAAHGLFRPSIGGQRTTALPGYFRQNPDPERDIPCSAGRLVETTVKLDRLPSALCNQVASSKFLGFFVFDGLIRRDEVSCERFAQGWEDSMDSRSIAV